MPSWLIFVHQTKLLLHVFEVVFLEINPSISAKSFSGIIYISYRLPELNS